MAGDESTETGTGKARAAEWTRRAVLTAMAAAVVAVPGGCASGSGGTPAAAPTALSGSPGSLVVEGEVARGLVVPWGVAFLPDGTALVAERDSARISRVGVAGGRPVPVGEITDAAVRVPDSEGGLLGLAVSPRFDVDRLVFAYYSASGENRVVRMSFDGTRLGLPQPVITGIPAGVFHDGGRITFGPDGMLYVGTGDAKRAPLAQDPASLGGKILRVTPEGRPAPGNPTPGSRVYSLGHRNVQGLAFDRAGRLWAGEHGENSWDELNLIRPGGNYGWPAVEGRADQAPDVTGPYFDPVRQWRPAEASPSGLAIVGDTAYLAALRGQRLWVIPLAGETAGRPRALFTERFGRLRTIVPATDGTLWLTTSNRDGRGEPRPGDDRILRLRPT